MSVFVERTWTAEDHLASLWELLEEERMIAHVLACSCDRHNFFCQFLLVSHDSDDVNEDENGYDAWAAWEGKRH